MEEIVRWKLVLRSTLCLDKTSLKEGDILESKHDSQIEGYLNILKIARVHHFSSY